MLKLINNINKRVIKDIILKQQYQVIKPSSSSSSLIQYRSFSSKKDKDNNNNDNNNRTIPDEFYDEDVEKEKEFLDITTALLEKGKLSNLTTMKKDSITWEQFHNASSEPISMNESDDFDEKSDEELYEKFFGTKMPNVEDMDDEAFDEFEEKTLQQPKVQLFTEAFLDKNLGEHLGSFPDSHIFPPQMLNYNVPWRKSEDEFALDSMIPDTDPNKYHHDGQGSRHCPGKRQRKGKKGNLMCHKIDLDDLHVTDVVTVSKFLSEDGQILGRSQTGLCAKCQRKVANTVKQGRACGLYPHLGEFIIDDTRPLHKDEHVHDVQPGQKYFVSKTIL
jgi:small subunit ribosomal protein S18